MMRRWGLVLVLFAACGDKGGGTGTGGAGGNTSGAGGTTAVSGAGGNRAPIGTGGAHGTIGSGGAGGALGTGGLRGIGGDRGEAGLGGRCPSIPSDFPPVCGAALCGNGRRDSCAGSCPVARTFTEACDGADLGDDTCQAHGFGSGALACTTSCSPDETPCRTCAAIGGALIACKDAPVTAVFPWTLGLAATDQQVGLSWLGSEGTEDQHHPLTFARLSPTLDLLGMTRLEEGLGPTAGGPSYRVALGTAVAPISAGWVVAVAGEPEVVVHAVGVDGRDLARTTVDRVGPDFFQLPAQVVLAARPGAGPLLLWRSDTAIRAALVAADGRSTGTPFDLPVDRLFTGSTVSAAFIGDAFYVTYELSDFNIAPPIDMIRVVRVDTSGTVRKVMDMVEIAIGPSLATDATDLRLTWNGPLPGGSEEDRALLWRRFSLTGQSLSPLIVLGRFPSDQLGFTPSVGLGTDTLLLLGSEGPALGVARLSADGTILTPRQSLARSRQFLPITGYLIARRGPEAVAAWMAPFDRTSRIEIARLMP